MGIFTQQKKVTVSPVEIPIRNAIVRVEVQERTVAHPTELVIQLDGPARGLVREIMAGFKHYTRYTEFRLDPASAKNEPSYKLADEIWNLLAVPEYEEGTGPEQATSTES